MLSLKEKAFGLNSRKETNWLIVSLIGFQYLLNLLYSWGIWHLDLIGYNLHRQLNSSLRKNFSWYSPIGVWFVITLIALVHSELEWLNCLIHGLPLVYEGSISVRSLFNRLRNCFPLRSNAWKVICHCLIILLLSSFLLDSNDSIEIRWSIEHKIINFTAMGSFVLFVAAISFMKWKTTRKSVN